MPSLIPERLKSPSVAFLHDMLMTVLAWFLASWVRFNFGDVPVAFIDNLTVALLILLPVQAAAFTVFGLYRGIWRFASLPDAMRIVKAVVVGTAVTMVLAFLVMRGDGIPRSIPVVYALMLIMLLGGPRLLYRWFKDRHMYEAKGPRVLIVGAGQAGEMLVRDMSRGALQNYQPVAFLDDNLRRQGRQIHGITIVGDVDSLPEVVIKRKIDMVLLAIPSATAKEKRRFVSLCEAAGVPFLSVPELKDLVSGRVAVTELREVSIEDLLGRDPVALDWSEIKRQVEGKRVLVSGSGGSIGSELCRQLSRLGPSELMLLDRNEFNLYQIEREIRNESPDLPVIAFLGDVLDEKYLTCVFQEYTPQLVFHAAAYKHVPMLEMRIRQALRNNVLGTRAIATAADTHGVETFVLVSTDKAVNPANVMGASKRVAEIFCQNLNTLSDTRFITVRFGNVLGSAGSVIPLFRQQIASGGPVTVTDPRMQRYFMTISEACQLILETTVVGEGGEIFVLDMGEPVKIEDLARQMIRLSGKEPGEDIEIVHTGLRPGEKLFEELFHEQEHLEGTMHPKVLLARHRKVDWAWLTEKMGAMQDACDDMDIGRLRSLLHALVPEFTQQEEPAESEATRIMSSIGNVVAFQPNGD